MKIKPRSYQVEAIDSTARALSLARRVLVVAPTASGKSIIIAELIRRYLKAMPESRVLVLCNQGHLLTQNEEKIKMLIDDADTGIYCASEGRKEFWNQTVLASRDSLGRCPDKVGKVDLIIVDEAHLVSVTAHEEKDDTNYARIFKAQSDEVRVVGLTGTPYRLGNGFICDDNNFFTKLAYEIKMKSLIDAGYLCQYVFPMKRQTVIDVSSLEVRATGDYSEADLDAVSSTDQVINECLDIWEREASDRRVTVFFCCSRIHAGKTKEHLGRRIGLNSILYIDGDLTGKKRVEELEKVKAGEYKAIVNVGVLTTGFDAPIIDCICFLRATASAALFVQMAGRGLRVSDGKANCLMLDMAGNWDRFKSIEEPFVPKKRGQFFDADGEGLIVREGVPIKECPECGYGCSPATKQCPECLHIFISHYNEVKTDGYDLVHKVESIHFERTETKAGDEAIIAHFQIGLADFHSKYLLINRPQKWADKHRSEWRQLSESNFFPINIRVTRKPKEKYFNLEILKWDYFDKSSFSVLNNGQTLNSEGVCQHTWIETVYAFTGYRHLNCIHCGENLK